MRHVGRITNSQKNYGDYPEDQKSRSRIALATIQPEATTMLARKVALAAKIRIDLAASILPSESGFKSSHRRLSGIMDA